MKLTLKKVGPDWATIIDRDVALVCCMQHGHLIGLPPSGDEATLEVSFEEQVGWHRIDRYFRDLGDRVPGGVLIDGRDLPSHGVHSGWFPEGVHRTLKSLGQEKAMTFWVRGERALKEITFCRRRVEGYDGEDVEYGWDGESARICFSEAERWLGWPRDVPDGTERTLRIWDAPADGRVPVRLGETGCFLGPPPGCWTIMWPQTMRALRLAAGTLDTVWVDSV